MVKIKNKKQLNLPQLIEWAWDNNVKGRMFITESDYCVGFDRHGFIYFNSINSMPLDQTFTVEVEEELTEDTEFEHLIEVTKDELHIHWSDSSVSGQMMPVSKEFHAYIDGKYELIWTREKRLVGQMKNKIDENLVLPKLIEIDDDGVRFEWNNKTINEIKNYQTKTIHAVIYGEFKLVWEKYKGLVE